MRCVLRRLEWIHVVGFVLVGIMLFSSPSADASQPCCGADGCECGATRARLVQKLMLCVLQQSIPECDCSTVAENTLPGASSPVALPSELRCLEILCLDRIALLRLDADESVCWLGKGVCPGGESIQPQEHGIRAPPGSEGNVLYHIHVRVNTRHMKLP